MSITVDRSGSAGGGFGPHPVITKTDATAQKTCSLFTLIQTNMAGPPHASGRVSTACENVPIAAMIRSRDLQPQSCHHMFAQGYGGFNRRWQGWQGNRLGFELLSTAVSLQNLIWGELRHQSTKIEAKIATTRQKTPALVRVHAMDGRKPRDQSDGRRNRLLATTTREQGSFDVARIRQK